MAGRDQRNEHRRQNGRLGPGVKTDVAQGTSRVSRAAGSIGSESMRVEQRSNPAATRQSSSRQAASKRTQSGKQATKKQAPAKQPAPTPTRDTRFIDWLRAGWANMAPHHQQRFLSVLLLILSLLFLGALTLFHQVPFFAVLYKLSTAFFGWSAYLLALGLIAFALAHFIEGMLNKRFIRGSLLFWLVALWLLVLLESRLLLGLGRAGILADFLAIPLSGWTARNAIIIHVLLIGLCVIFVIAAFGIRFGHVLMIGRAIGKRGAPGGTSAGTSPYLGQRPQYSRYGTGLPAPDNAKQAAGEVDEEDEDDDSLIEFEDDFDGAADDPLNDISLHKDEIRLVPRGPRSAQSLNREEHNDAVQGARQQQLPFNQDKAQMEPLAPNPMRNNQPVVITRAAGAQSQAALEPPWKLPDIKLLNNPEEVKLHMFGDDTKALAKIIQDTLRSFRVDAEVKEEDISIGPTVIRFGIRPTGKPETKLDAQGRSVPVKDASGNIVYESRTRVNRIMALQSDLALVLEAKSIRMEAPVPGRPYIGVEIPNKNSRLVTLREVLESKEYLAVKAKSKLAVALGKDVAGTVRAADLARMPHALIAGATGAGKCLAYGEPVFLADGRVVKVQDLIGQTIQVIGITDDQTMQQTPVFATFTENGIQEVFEIELDTGLILRRTGEHPLWAASLDENQHVGRQSNGKAKRRTRAIDAGWVPTKDLHVCGNRPHFDGHVILCSLALQQRGTVSRSDADVILCAALLAEGALNHYDHLSYMRTPRFTNADSSMVELVAGAAREYGCQLVVSPHKVKGNIDYYISQPSRKGRGSGNPVARLVHDWGIACRATEKTIPEWVFQLPNQQIALFLRIFVDCDGWIDARENEFCSVNIALANPVLIHQIGQLALRLGITGTYLYKDNGHAGAWTWTTYMVKEWQERVGSSVKTEKLERAVMLRTEQQQQATTQWTAWRRAQPLPGQKFADCPEGYEWRKIVAIRRITAPTVNIEVHTDNHAFVGYAVEHNSVSINAIIGSILMQATPDDVRLLMVDPKMVELIMYNGIPHLLTPVVTEVEKVVAMLKIAIVEMEKRYRLFSQLGVRNLDGYRKQRAERIARGDTSLKNLPAIVIIIDELADLMMSAPEEIEGMICRLAQLARATGIHLVIATQRPSVDVITGLIKANIPTRISFMVSSAVDSRTIIDMGGAERLLGRGDMLYLPADAGKPERIQGAFVADDEVDNLVNYWKQQVQERTALMNRGKKGQDAPAMLPVVEPGWEISKYISDDIEMEDDLLEEAERVVREYERASISLLQRRLRIGYSRAARLIDLLEARGVIGLSEAGGRSWEVLDDDNGHGRHGNGEGRTMADEAADIIAEEKARADFLKAREEFVKKQGAAKQPTNGQQGYVSSKGAGKDDDVEELEL